MTQATRNKSFLSNLLLLLVLNVLIKPIHIFAIDAGVQNSVGDSSYGQYFAIFNFVFIFLWILDPGIQNYTVQYLAKDRNKIAQSLPILVGAKALAAILFTLVTGVATLWFFGQEYLPIVVRIIINMSLLSFWIFFKSHFSAMGHYVTDTLLSTVDKLFMIGVLGYLLYFSNYQVSIITYLNVQGLALLFATLVTLVYYYIWLQPITIKIDIKAILDLLPKTAPFALVFILMSLYIKMDGIMLAKLIDDDEVSAGIYAAAFRVYDAMTMVGYLFSSLLLPMFANTLTDKIKLSELFDEAIRAMLAIAGLLCVSFIFYREPLFDFIYDNVSHVHTDTFFYLMLGFFCVALTYVTGTLITATADLRRMNWLFVLGIIVNWSLNWYMIPTLGPVGAAIATLCTQALILTGQIVLCKTTVGVKYHPKLVIKYLLLVALIVIVHHFTIEWIDTHFLIQMLISGIISGVCILTFGFIRLDSVLR